MKGYPSDTKASEYQRKYIQSHPWVRTMQSIRTRCNHPSHKFYKNYGGKGIKVLITLDELKSLWLRDNASSMKQPSIDRINPNGHYEIDNCRFIECSINRSRPNREKTHCINGHEFTEDNIYYTKHKFSRLCRACRKIWNKKYQTTQKYRGDK